MTHLDPAPSDAASPPRRSFDSPWFWICLFSCAAAVSLVVIGPKFEKREAQLEKKLKMREHLSQHDTIEARQAQRSRDANGERSEGTAQETVNQEALLKTTGPLIWGLIAVGLFSWVMFIRSRNLWRKNVLPHA
jgi:hypothetical protein